MKTHSVEDCGADRFNNEAVIKTQFLQVLVEVIWESQPHTNRKKNSEILKK